MDYQKLHTQLHATYEAAPALTAEQVEAAWLTLSARTQKVTVAKRLQVDDLLSLLSQESLAKISDVVLSDVGRAVREGDADSIAGWVKVGVAKGWITLGEAQAIAAAAGATEEVDELEFAGLTVEDINYAWSMA
ncbi:MAG: hypothetical protein GC162_10405 [Planctomycetes bacterium]|nr:hypothetical protein [Planctomycetota bacterium]